MITGTLSFVILIVVLNFIVIFRRPFQVSQLLVTNSYTLKELIVSVKHSLSDVSSKDLTFTTPSTQSPYRINLLLHSTLLLLLIPHSSN